MRFEWVKNLKGDEVLGRSVTDSLGNTLLTPGTRLNQAYIKKLEQQGIFSLYVQDDSLKDIVQDEKAAGLKYAAMNKLPELFKCLAYGRPSDILDSYNAVKELIDYIIEEGDVKTNLFEINKYDNYTYVHCIDTGMMATFLGMAINMPKEELRLLGEGAVLHDIGKIIIPEKIINKNGPLTSEEYEIVKKHPMYGYRILKQSKIQNSIILDIVCNHHEKYNGTGYPNGKSGKELSIFSKIVTLCDIFTALSSNRSYRNRFNPNEAYEYILSNSGVLFDPEIVNIFKKAFAIYPLGCHVKLSNNVEGFIVSQNPNFPDRPVVRVIYDNITGERIPFYDINLMTNLNLTICNVLIN